MVKGVVLSLAVSACIWDSDTIDDELRGLPESVDLVTGRWYRHGADYYRARLEKLPERLKASPDDLEAYDDLAVAHERLGDREAAIRVMEDKGIALRGKTNKEHLYRYHANLGTFYAHSGRLEAAAIEIDRALVVNPEAHFGRERFQLDAIRYVMAALKDRSLWKRSNFLSWAGYEITGISHARVHLVPSHTEKVRPTKTVDWKEAYTAVAGMLRYGGLEGAELYRVLGDLLLARNDLNLAWYSYQHAVERNHPASVEIRAALLAIEEHWRYGGMTTVPTMDDYRSVRAAADRWLAHFHEREREALAKGRNPAEPETLKEIVKSANRAEPLSVLPGPRMRIAFQADAGLAGWIAGVAAATVVLAIAALAARRRSTPRRRFAG